MTTELNRLIEAVEMGAATTMKFDDALTGHDATAAELAYRGSLDAAVLLLDALLPGWWAEISIAGRVNHAEVEEAGGGETSCADNMPSPARALLLAVLRAKLMEMEGE